MSFANQALSAEHVAKNHADLEPRVYTVPREIDDEVARLKLESMEFAIDELTDEQRRYMDTWDEGT
jgi:adenosylhomocysteinase